MKVINTKIHGVLDYLVAILLIAFPQIFSLDMNSSEGQIPMGLGIATIIYSLLTAYEMSIAKVISMKMHLIIDFASGLLLASSPWLFGFADQVYLPHLIIGIVEIVVSLMSKAERDNIKNNLI